MAPWSFSSSEQSSKDSNQQTPNNIEKQSQQQQEKDTSGDIASSAEDEPDDWDKRIFSTGCAVENTRLNDCYFEKKDWRACKEELEAFKRCWQEQGNSQRTSQKDV